jgi:hypothetical protein
MSTTLVTRQDSDGYDHEICEQSQQNTCAAASLFMVSCMRLQMSLAGGEDQIRKLAGRGESTWANGMYDREIYDVMKGLCGVSGWEQASDVVNKPLKLSPGKVYYTRPALVCVRWIDTKGKVVGGHAVAVPWFTDDGSKIVYLDPWKGQLVERVNDGRFSSKSGAGKIGFVCYS